MNLKHGWKMVELIQLRSVFERARYARVSAGSSPCWNACTHEHAARIGCVHRAHRVHTGRNSITECNVMVITLRCRHPEVESRIPKTGLQTIRARSSDLYKLCSWSWRPSVGSAFCLHVRSNLQERLFLKQAAACRRRIFSS